MAPGAAASVLVLNAGSSSVKFGVYEVRQPLRQVLGGHLDDSRPRQAMLSWHTQDGARDETQIAGYEPALLLDWLAAREEFASVTAVGHRLVHGMRRTEPAQVTREVIDELQRATRFAPEHLPRETSLVEILLNRYPDLPQVAAFDTAFHRDMPPFAQMLSIPRRYYAEGIQRYGFHGLSYAFLVEELARVAGAEVARGRLILAHLGNGASLAAVREGTSVDTSMGFTPASGLVMSTRTGDLDPGVMSYLAEAEGMTARQFHTMINHESGLLGISETSADMRDLLAHETADARAAEAVALFCYQAKKWIGAFAAALGGLDVLVFSGGIGERSAPIRGRICDGLGFLGIELDNVRNEAHAAVISSDRSGVGVRVIRTDEEFIIARSVCQVLGLHPSSTDTSL